MADYIDPLVQEIGVANTIIKLNRKISLFNTDFYGIYQPIKKAMNTISNPKVGKQYGLVLGAGATSQTACYVLIKMDIEPIIYNRSEDNLNKLSQFVKQKTGMQSVIGDTDIHRL